MNERKATKRALLTSITALVMCVVMLAGTTFAWFTDTASTNVNKIQAGKLDVALEMYDTTQSRWVNAEGKTLNWVKATTGSGQATLWEPGAEYKLPELKVVNNGNLALKYEIAITGAVDADGRNDLDSMKLLNVLKFKSVVGSDTKENVYGQPIATGTLETNGAEQIIKLSAKMDENAGNGYMNMALSNITVTVKAMQASFEHDSNGNTYDQDANGNPDNPTWSVSAHVTANVATGDTVLRNADGTVELTAPAGSTGATSLTLKVEPKTAVDSNITVNAGQTAQPYEISLVDENNGSVTAGNGKVFNVKLYVGKGLSGNSVKVYHNSTEITGAQYDSDSGYVTFTTDSFSPFTVVFDTPVAIVGDTYYYTLSEAVTAAKDGNTITLVRDVELSKAITIEKAVTLDLNGHTIANSLNSNGYSLVTKAAATIVNGTYKGTGTARGIGAYGNLTMRNVTVDVAGQVGVACSVANSQYTIEDSTIKGGYALCNFSNNATINVSNSTLEGESVGFYHNGSNSGLKLTVTGTKINADNNGTDATGVYISGSTATRDAAGYQKASFTDCTVKGNAAIEVKYTDLTLNNCIVTATVDSANASYKQNNNGSTTNGFAVVSTDNATKNTMPTPEGTITINGGSYTGLIGLHNFSEIQTNFPGFVDTTYVINR